LYKHIFKKPINLNAVRLKGIILVDFGAPSNVDELRDFLINMHNRNPTESELKNVMKKYELSGGSPIRNKIQGLRKMLEEEVGSAVDYAFLYNKPYLKDIIDFDIKAGIKNIIVLPLFTFYSRKTAFDIERNVSHYRDVAQIEIGPEASNIECVSDLWGKKLKSDLDKLDEPAVVFTAHSIPVSTDGSAEYARSFYKFAEKISFFIKNRNYLAGFQNTHNGWLGPSIYDLPIGRHTDVVVVPLSFLLTNMEVLYDLDVEYSQHLRKMGYRYIRSGPPDDSRELARCLASSLFLTF